MQASSAQGRGKAFGQERKDGKQRQGTEDAGRGDVRELFQAGKLRAGGTAELRIPAEAVFAHRVSPSLLTLDDAGNVGIKIINESGEVEFVVADVALSTNNGVWLAGLPETATIITVGQGYVSNGAMVDAVPESDAETAVAIMGTEDDD